ncbi:nucleotide sugar dehydrogenase [Halorubrum sp. Ib24]|uniref:nucleotide sugar dehydrogenase n=1 Tax=unclassified Halorubrum TaxID=2642239 RepID=UPI000B98EAC5|nr:MULTISPECIES: nucleotide sugar dehydrogenase [unclassified Halorubrum]OYR39223.1 nucleotide sugar dehydrogenase [Halorubrum sp. Eb13]OYR41831.1 nucleotide sugar dehydrogenase [Halorubrum sp. Ib24]OYR47005.1 nucleotide sugar dehydrogenase [Halorubrum sp. Hd13]OYR47938.1 nucleotide sugar dehydrogenase [Halorubrum sp. Ea8]OYR53212.1 nucleotide sugar dehydrogenase [Halorubrum sp. Ea1]
MYQTPSTSRERSYADGVVERAADERSTADRAPDVESATVCVVGLGYVGVPLAVAFDEQGYDIVGYDIDPDRVAEFRNDRDPTEELGDDRIADSQIRFTDDPTAIRDADYVLITVPTPLDSGQNPELAFVRSAAETVAEHVSEDTTIVLESTVYPGVTRDTVAPIVEEGSGFTLGDEFHVGYSPERLSPGDQGRTLQEAVKIVSADTARSLEELAALYDSAVDAGVYRAPSIETAEAAKVLENVQRDLNIALMNEMAIICDHLGLDTSEVIDAAATKWNFHDYSPGLVGGHCIPVDPLYLAHGSERAGFSPKLIFQGREVNEYMPKHVAEVTVKAFNAVGTVPRDARLLILGAAYKPNVGDIRTSEVKSLVAALGEYDVDCAVCDPVVDDEVIADAFGTETATLGSFDDFDGIVLATPHDAFADLDYERVAESLNSDPVFVDVDGVADRDEIGRAGYEYRRL